MALFPAFAEVSRDKVADSSSELNWLNNKSFQTSDALSLHSRFLEKKSDELLNKDSSKDGKDEDSVPVKKKKHEKHGKKKKKHKEKIQRSTESSGSDSEPIFPSDLKRKELDRPQAAPIASSFSWLDDIQSTITQPFCVDSKSDASNWTYKSLYRGDVARYRRKGSSTLGLDRRRQEVSWEDAKKKRKGRDKQKGEDRYFSRVCRQLLRSQLPLLTLPRVPESSHITKSSVFLSLEDNEGEKKEEAGVRIQTSSVNPLGVYDSTTALWLQGKGKQEQIDPDDKPSLETGQEVVLQMGQTEEFNRKLRETPEDTQLWLKFIRYQDELSETVFGGEEDQQSKELERPKSSYKAVLEKKLSIAERAVATNPSCVALQRERLRICQELWEPSALAKEWKKLVFLHPNSGPLWKEYLLFTQSYFSNFSVSKVNTAYGKCLSMLSAVRDGSMVSHPALPGIEEDMLDIFIQQCHFLRQCGHSEKAFSLFQAMVEFTFFKPDSVQQLSTKQQAEFFEPFWDSGEARVGEWDARGWKAWMIHQERGGWVQPSADEEEEEEEDEEEEVKDRSQPRWTVWLDVESSREAAHWLPWRPEKNKGQSEDDCDDPERQVLFDDIGPSLICLSSSELQLRLLLNFLSFLGLPVDNVLSAGNCLPGLLLEELALLTQGSDSRHALTSHNLPNGMSSVGHMTTLQGTRKWTGLGKQGEKFVNTMFHMLQPVLSSQHRTILSLSRMQYEKLKVFRCLNDSKKRLRSQSKISKRIAKSLLKEPDNRSSLAMWREFAHMEWLLGNVEEARKVFSTATALGGGKGLCNPSLCELCLLWAQLEVEYGANGPGGVLNEGGASPAVCVLTKLASGSTLSSSSQPVSPVAILKARKLYEQALTASLSALDQDLCNAHANEKGQVAVLEEKVRLGGLLGCYALFQYLTMGIKAASAVYTQNRERMEELQGKLESEKLFASNLLVSRMASECEILAVQQASLLKYHIGIGVFPLATLRDTLTSALIRWPSSAPLWSIYVQVENRYHSAGRARRFFHTVTRENASIVPRLFAIVAEQQRKQLVDAAQRSSDKSAALSVLPENGLSNRIRGLFESAVGTEMGAHCPLLWRMYIHYLVSEGKTDKAKGLFYKALQNIPWVKGLYMDAVQLFHDHLQEFVDLMTEKELRVRLPLEELDILLED
ncbi:nuclear exosome regulator NRDE2 [Corythoichthys intestinalis]|uniref:nuclear exosome regulator NRDE2 n=1 Tax=Corythoichthys intestinalis TaxID=161448 RepID=UPI0025A5A1E9|nr:nuclear exosome regulator NRDE2 [Corythoichthys intestinalis]